MHLHFYTRRLWSFQNLHWMFWSISVCILWLQSLSLCKQLSAKTSALLNSIHTCCTLSLLVLNFSSPDIQRDWHHGVKNDDVGPEGEEGWEQEVVYRKVPGQIALKQGAYLSLPHCVTRSQDHPHTHQEAKDLTETIKKIKVSKCMFRSLRVGSLVTKLG